MGVAFAKYIHRAIASRKKTVAELAHEQITDEQKANLRACYQAYLANRRRAARERGSDDEAS